MSILIKGIDLPKKIKGQHGVEWECETYIELYIRSDGVVFDDDFEEVGQAIQIPRPHGRLIDGDLVADMLDSMMAHGTLNRAYDEVLDVPTILEAEE